MSKAWRNPRQVVVHEAPPEPDDSKRITRLVSLLATGMERLLDPHGDHAPEIVDFPADVSHVYTRNKTKDEESA